MKLIGWRARLLAGWLAASLLLAGCSASATPAATPGLGAPGGQATAEPPAATPLATQAATFAAPTREPIATAGTPAAAAPGPLALSPCFLEALGGSARLAAECGTLNVPENPANPSGRHIGLNVAVVRATGRDPAPDPVFFLAGGPGQAASETYSLLAHAFERVNRERDIVLVDQRGTGRSNPLECAVAEQANPPEAAGEVAEAVRACLADLGGDPRFYTTPVAMDDLDAVRAALGYEQINLYGVSYGTRAALTYLRQHEDRVRSVVLDGVVPSDEALGLDVARDAQRALELVLARCAAEAGCREAYPGLPAEFAALAERLQAEPARLAVPDPVSGEPAEVTFTHDLFVTAVRLLTYSPETVAVLPLLIHTAYARDDFRPLAAQALLVTHSLEDSLSAGMSAAVLCSEDEPFFTDAQAAEANTGTYLGNTQTDNLRALCAAWPGGPVPAGYKAPVASPVPTLLLSGEADPVTPPENAERVAASLPNSRHLVAPGQGHNVVGRGCLPQLMADFYAAGSAAGLATGCVDRITPMPFFVSFAGPRP